jgi:hypothetical protein
MENRHQKRDNQPTINFFWSGDDWSYLHNMTIKSHIKCDHHPVIWVHGNTPRSKWWDDSDITVRNADDIVSISDFMAHGGNFKTASSVWRFMFLYKYGGWYADTDAMAINTWPDQKWVLCSNYNGMISTGVIKIPSHQDMMITALDNIQYNWGNVKVFNNAYRIQFGHNKETYNGKSFFPFIWKDWRVLINNDDMSSWEKYVQDDTLSIHLYHTMFERAEMVDTIDVWIQDNPNTMLGALDRWIKE